MPHKTKDCPLETDSGISLPRSTPTEFTEHEEVELVPTRRLHLCVIVSLVKEDLLQATKRETNTNQNKKPLPTVCPAYEIC